MTTSKLNTLIEFGIDKDTAETLLAINNDDITLAIDMFLESNQYEPPIIEPPPNDECQFCKTHQDKMQDKLILFSGCDHPCCKTCLTKKYMEDVYENKKSPFRVQCPFCQSAPSFAFIEKHAPEKAMQTIKEMYLATLPSTKHIQPDKISEKELPFTLSDFQYGYNEKGQLKRKDRDAPTSFAYFTERHYEAVGHAVQDYIQEEMKNTYNMKEIWVDPPKADVATGKLNQYVNVFVSPQYESKEKLLLLIQGSGKIRPGMWARKLCLNANLSVGSQLPYIKKAIDKGWGIVVLNPNQNRRRLKVDSLRFDFYNPSRFMSPDKKETEPIKGNESGAQHAITVWNALIEKAKASKIAIVAHSAGGWATAELCRNMDIQKRIQLVVFQDSFSDASKKDSPNFKKFLSNSCISFSTSSKPLGSLLRPPTRSGCLRLSAGTRDHDSCPGTTIEKTFACIEERWQ